MEPRAVSLVLAALLALGSTASAVDPAFKLLKEDVKVNVYSRDARDCGEAGADVLFVVENKTKERLELKMELLNMRIKNKLTVVVEPASNTSVLSLSPDAAMCGVELVDMKVNSLAAPTGEKAVVPVTASTGDEPKI
jgi:hypothetical protein